MYFEFIWTTVFVTLLIIQQCFCDSMKLKVFRSDVKSSQHVSTQTTRSFLECAALFTMSNSLAFSFKEDEKVCKLSDSYPGNSNEIAEGWKLTAPIVNGGWNDWALWSACSATCGDGTMSRTRSWQAPPTSNGGTPCAGDASEETRCTSSLECFQPILVATGEVLPLSTATLTCVLEYWPTGQAVDGNLITASLAHFQIGNGGRVKPYWHASFDNLIISEVEIYVHEKSHAAGYTVTISDVVLSEDSCVQQTGSLYRAKKCVYTPPTATQVASDLNISMNTDTEVLEIHEITLRS